MQDIDVKLMKNKYFLGKDFPGVYFTFCEALCMKHLLEGLSQGTITEKTGLSLKSIDFFYRTMGRKLSCNSLEELIRLVKETEFMHYLSEF
ncbi:MAG: LuxR C-terminal-related transcriptional regulator [Gammaproteobacteria bacterium]